MRVLQPGETVAVFGAGGLGMSAIQLARGMGALDVYAVDINPEKLALAESYGAIPVNAAVGDPVAELKRLTGGKGVDVALELIGLPLTMRQSVLALGPFGRAVLAGVTEKPFEINGYYDLIGKHMDGGYAEYIAVPERSAIHLPDEISFEHAAAMRCSSSTAFHALRKGRLQPGETVAVFGAGGLGMSAIQLARGMGALDVYAVDINPEKLKQAEGYGAIPVNAAAGDPVAELRRLTGGKGVDVALELIGLPLTMRQSVLALGVFGRAVLAGVTEKPFEINGYYDLIGKEAEVIGCSDHLMQEFPLLLEYGRRGVLDLSQVVTRTIPLDADAINEAMDALEQFGGAVRTVITP